MTDSKMKVIFAPGVLEDMEAEMSTEDLQAFLDQFKEMVENGTLTENSTEIDMDELESEDPELFALLQERMMYAEDDISNLPQPTLH